MRRITTRLMLVLVTGMLLLTGYCALRALDESTDAMERVKQSRIHSLSQY